MARGLKSLLILTLTVFANVICANDELSETINSRTNIMVDIVSITSMEAGVLI